MQVLEPGLELCPLCRQALSVQQINFNSAIVICINTKCSYPFPGESITISRGIKDVKKPIDIKMLVKNVSAASPQCSEHSEQNFENEAVFSTGIYGNGKAVGLMLHENSAVKSFSGNDQVMQVSELDEFISQLLQ